MHHLLIYFKWAVVQFRRSMIKINLAKRNQHSFARIEMNSVKRERRERGSEDKAR